VGGAVKVFCFAWVPLIVTGFSLRGLEPRFNDEPRRAKLKNLDGKKLLLRVVIVILCVLAHQRPAVGQGWSNGYGFRRAITIDHTQVPNTDQANFPVLVSGTFASLATTANGGNVTNANGYDIILTSDAAGTTLLPFEQEVYNPSTGAIVYWVKIPTVSHTSDTVFYLFYGNSSISTSQSNKNGVWDSNYVGVWHLPNGSTLNANDSTSNANNGTINGATPTNGEIDGAASLNGSNQNITVNKQYGLTSNLTFSAWVKFSGLSGYQEILGQDTSSWTGGNVALTPNPAATDAGETYHVAA